MRSLLLILPLVCGCAALGTVTDAVRSAQRELGHVKPKLKRLLEEYDAQANARIDHCESLDLPDRESARRCLGVYDPASNLSLAVNRARELYNGSADDLQNLLTALELIELSVQGPSDGQQ